MILGHSERRRSHHETNEQVAAKVRAAWAGGLSTIVCIGETQEQRTASEARAVCGAQLAASPPDLQAGCETSVAYEPLWAIGSGHMPTAHDIADIHSHIRSCLVARFGDAGRTVQILYGGSVKPSNAHDILAVSEVGGVLIGGASLVAADFNGVLEVIDECSGYRMPTRPSCRRPDAIRPD